MFGNAQLGADAADLESAGMGNARTLVVVAPAGTRPATRAGTYGDVGEGELLLLVDSSRRLALACNRGDAAGELRIAPGDAIEIRADGQATAQKA